LLEGSRVVLSYRGVEVGMGRGMRCLDVGGCDGDGVFVIGCIICNAIIRKYS
jgi:hypothetical protein